MTSPDDIDTRPIRKPAPPTAPTEQEATECLETVGAVLAALGIDVAVSRVREHASWTDPVTGEHYPPHWVIEIRRSWPDQRTLTATFEFEDWRIMRKDPRVWADLLRMELSSWS